MKILAFIVSVFILFLTVKPEVEFAIFNVETDHCCDNLPLENSKSDNQKNCSSLACNPFHGCGACKNVFIYSSFSSNQSQIESISCIYNIKSSFISFYIPDFWKPPRHV